MGLNTFEGDSQFEEFGNYFGEIGKEFIVVSSIYFDPFLKNFILIMLLEASGMEYLHKNIIGW
jgi:hypothetical protein